MKNSSKLVSLAALTAAIVSLPAAATGLDASAVTGSHGAGMAQCATKCSAKCTAKCGAKCAPHKHKAMHGKCSAHKGKAAGAPKCGAKCGAKCAPKCGANH
jgi:hypothetical protein